jgi:hypothetical protein
LATLSAKRERALAMIAAESLLPPERALGEHHREILLPLRGRRCP